MSASVLYVNFNGHLEPSDKALLGITNRAFRYGDGVFESMRVSKGKIPFLTEHLERLKKACAYLKLNLPNDWLSNRLTVELNELLQKNGISDGGRIRLTIYRMDGGLYTPTSNQANYTIEASGMEQSQFELNAKGLLVDLFPDIKKQIHALSNFKSNNCLPYVMAGIHKTEKKLDDCLLINEKGHVCEAISSNVFLVINGALYTPALSEGCLDGVMRRIILQEAPKHRINIYEPAIMPNDLLRADEVFLSNSIQGIQWVGSYKSKRYFNSVAKKITGILNDLIQ